LLVCMCCGAPLINRPPQPRGQKQSFGTNELIMGVGKICVLLRKIRQAHRTLSMFNSA
jgi:hypothetical protein